MDYFVMVCEGAHPVMPIGSAPKISGSWRTGDFIAHSVPAPLVYTLDTDYEGAPKAMYYEESVPVMRDDVAAALADAGVDNIQYFPAILRNPKTGQEHRNYKAYNILGTVAAADMSASELMGTSDSDIGDVDFHALVIDETKTRGLLLFRLAEATNAVVVHRNVKERIEAAGIPGFVFYGPGEWSG